MIFLLLVAIWVADESDKVRPDAVPVPGPVAIHLAAAGGECAGAQLVVRGPVQALSAKSSGFPIDLYRVATIFLQHPSGPEGSTGEWPDALIPTRDALFGEERKVFPVDVGKGRAQAIFVESCAPRGGGPALLKGAVKLSWRGGALEVPVQLKVRSFDLPATPPLATAFGFSGYSAARGHRRGPEANRELTRLYDWMALRRGITLFGGTQNAPEYTARGNDVTIDWTDYDAEVAPFLDGTALPSGARWTSVELREPGKLTREQRRSWRRAWVEHFRARGWLDRLFRYVEDEPAEARLAEVEGKAAEVRDDAPEVRRLLTTAPSDKLKSVDLFVPLLNCFAGTGPTCPRGGRGPWWYQSCMSHGCQENAHPAFRGWPSYMIDAPATAARAMGALAFANGVSGELYFDVDYIYEFTDPWISQWGFGGNGDGTLYYPGTPARIGGLHDVPVESLRLIQIARGLSDHAYLSLCAQLGDPGLARSDAQALAPGLRNWARDPHAYARMREKVAARIETLLARAKLGAR